MCSYIFRPQTRTSTKQGNRSTKKNNGVNKSLSIGKPRLNESLVEKISKDEFKTKQENKKQTSDVSFLSQLSVEGSKKIPKRPKSSQSFGMKNEKGRKLIENFKKVFKDKKLPKSEEKQSKKQYQSNHENIQNDDIFEKIKPRSKSKENNKADSLTEPIKVKLDSQKAALSVYQTRAGHRDSPSQPHQHIKKNSLRDQARPNVQMPPSKVFPKELALINKILITEKQKGTNKNTDILGLGVGNKKMMFISKGKILSKSVCIDVFFFALTGYRITNCRLTNFFIL